MHRIDIFDRTFNSLTSVFQPNVYNLEYSTELSKAGQATFTIRVKDPKATVANLKLFNRIKIFKGTKGVFIGYIEELRATLNEIEVSCMGMLALFNKREYTANIIATQADTAFFDILTATNADDDTGVNQGTSDIITTVNDVQFERSKILTAWNKIANMVEGEYEIDINQDLNFQDTIGVDKSSSIILQYISDQIPAATIFEFDVEISGKNMINKLTGIRNAGGTSVKSDATSITNFGLLQGSKNFAQTADSTDLDNETQNFVDSRKDEFYTPRIRVNVDKIDIDDLDVGDTIKVVLNNGFIVVNQNHRIIRKTSNVSANKTVIVDLGLIPTTTNLLPSSFFDDIVNIEDRVSLLEGNI